MTFKMKGSPHKMGGIQGTTGHSSALKQGWRVDTDDQTREGLDHPHSQHHPTPRPNPNIDPRRKDRYVRPDAPRDKFGGPPMKSPMKQWWRDAWDKATQIGMGAKAFLKEAVVDEPGGQMGYAGSKDPVYKARQAYEKEKELDRLAKERRNKKNK